MRQYMIKLRSFCLLFGSITDTKRVYESFLINTGKIFEISSSFQVPLIVQ